MLTRWKTRIRNKWKVIGGALAVLLMFFVPATRAVLAQTLENQEQPAGDANQLDYDTSDSGPTTPVNPSPMTTTGSSTSQLGPADDAAAVPEAK